MNAQEFRENANLRSELAQALQIPAVQFALAIAKGEYDGADVADGGDALASAKLLSRRAGAERAVARILGLVNPPAPEQDTPSMTFGTPYKVEEFDKP